MNMKIYEEDLKESIKNAEKRATNIYGTTVLEVEHVFLTILKEDFNVQTILNIAGVSYELLKERIELYCKNNVNIDEAPLKHSNSLKNTLKRAKEDKQGDKVDCIDFIITATKVKNNISDILKDEKITAKAIMDAEKQLENDIRESLYEDEIMFYENEELYYDGVVDRHTSNINDTNILNFAVNLSELARENKLNKSYGRNDVINQCLEALEKKQKRNVLLIGQPGVGKSNIVEGLAYKIPTKNIYSFDLNKIASGTKYRGDLELRMNAIIDFLKNEDVIGFFDEAHMLRNGVGSEDGLSLMNVLKPSMARNEVQLIFATTNEEHQRHLDKDRAFLRRCSLIEVNEPDKETSCMIMEKFAKTHNAKISKKDIEYIYGNAKRYISNRYMPDIGIEILDTCYAKAKMNTHSGHHLDIKERLMKLEEQKFDIVENSKYEKVFDVKKEEAHLKKLLSINKNRPINKISINEDIIKAVFAKNYKIHINEPLTYDNYQQDLNRLNTKIIGQSHQLSTILEKIVVNKHTELDKPCSFFLLGPTGVGKTKTVKEIAKKYYNNNLLRIDCSEYQEAFSISNLIGSPIGYVGNEQGGILTNHLIYNPHCVVLFDEIEKGHPSIYNLLLSMLDEGYIKDKKGNIAYAKNALIFFTSNVGYSDSVTPIGFDAKPVNNTKDISKQFKKEFLNRIDEIVYYNYLTKKDYKQFLEQLISRTRNTHKDIKIIFSKNFKEEIINTAFDKGYGIRYLEGTFKKNVLKKIIFSKMQSKKMVRV